MNQSTETLETQTGPAPLADEVVMSDSIDNTADAPKEQTTEPAEQAETEDAQSPGGDKAEKRKSGFQKRIERLSTQRDEARTQREQALRENYELHQRLSQMQVPQQEQYQDTQDYQRALSRYDGAQAGLAANQIATHTRADYADQLRATQEQQMISELVSAGSEKYPDMGIKVSDPSLPSLPVNQPAAMEAILAMDNAEDVIYHIASNKKLAHELVKMTPIQAVMRVTKLQNEVSKKKAPISGAPSPVSMIGSSSTTQKDPSKMSYDEYRKWRMSS